MGGFSSVWEFIKAMIGAALQLLSGVKVQQRFLVKLPLANILIELDPRIGLGSKVVASYVELLVTNSVLPFLILLRRVHGDLRLSTRFL